MTGNAALISDGAWCILPDGAGNVLDASGGSPCGCGPNTPCCSEVPNALCAAPSDTAVGPSTYGVALTYARRFRQVRLGVTLVDNTRAANTTGNFVGSCVQLNAALPLTVTNNLSGVVTNTTSTLNWNGAAFASPPPIASGSFEAVSFQINGSGVVAWSVATILGTFNSSGVPPIPSGVTISVAVGGCAASATASVSVTRVNGLIVDTETIDLVYGVTGPVPCPFADCADCDNSDLEPAP